MWLIWRYLPHIPSQLRGEWFVRNLLDVVVGRDRWGFNPACQSHCLNQMQCFCRLQAVALNPKAFQLPSTITATYCLRQNGAAMGHCFLKAVLPIPKRRTPAPRRAKVTGQGRGQPKNGLGMRAKINIESRINNTPATIRSHLDTVTMVCTSFFWLLTSL